MFSYFRHQHRKSGSSPSSPDSVQWYSYPSASSAETPEQPYHSRLSDASTPPATSPISPKPPVLPPIQRVSSAQERESLPEDRRLAVDKRPSATDLRLPEISLRKRDFSSIVPTLTIPDLPVIPRANAQQSQQKQTQKYPPSQTHTIFGRSTPPPGTDDDTQKRYPFRQSRTPLELHKQQQQSQSQSQSQSQPTHPASQPPNQQKQQQQQQQQHRPCDDNERATRSSVQPHLSGQRKSPLAPTFNASREHPPRPTSSSSRLSYSELQVPAQIPSSTKRASSPSPSSSSYTKSAFPSNLAVESSYSSISRLSQNTGASVVRPQKASRINLLNPMSLLLRRRSSNNDASPEAQLIPPRGMDVPAITVPENYDPRIRGKGVHDFNAPRPKRKNSEREDVENRAEEAGSEGSDPRSNHNAAKLSGSEAKAQEIPIESGTRKGSEKQHTPVFTENFDDDVSSSETGVQRESLANPAFLARVSQQLDISQFEPAEPQISVRKSVSDPLEGTQQTKAERMSKQTVSSSHRVSSDQSTARSSIASDDTRATSPLHSPNQPQSRNSFTTEAPVQPSALPKHLSSTASRASSRFSFQLNSDRSIATEKSLEEKHKQKFANKHDSLAEDDFEASENEQFANFDMDDGVYEEDIPYSNDDDGEGVGYSGFGSIDSPRNLVQTDALGLTREVPKTSLVKEGSMSTITQKSSGREKKTSFSLDEDDMYYDDGLIQEDSFVDEVGHFDEAELDKMERSQSHRSQGSKEASAATLSDRALPPEQPQANYFHPQNLDAYHNALASAANKAEADGRFLRRDSFHIDDMNVDPDLSRDANGAFLAREQIDEDEQMNHFAGSNYEDFDLAEDLEDDPLIAAANAEVLASDDSEFYGREFGFYGHSVGDSEFYNGGYLGGTDANGIGRSTSGRNYSREPNLTPITERSEFSTRNSVISMNASGFFSLPLSSVQGSAAQWDQTLPSPGLKELASTIALEEDDMTLSQLMKLRKGTFGERRGSWTGGNSGGSPNSPGNSLLISSPLSNPQSASPRAPKSSTGDRSFGEVLISENEADNNDEDGSEDDNLIDELNQLSGSTSRSTSPTISNAAAFGGGSNDATPKPRRQLQAISASSLPPPPPPVFLPQNPLAPPLTFVSPQTSTSSPISPGDEASAPMPPASLMSKFAGRPPAASYHSPTHSQNQALAPGQAYSTNASRSNRHSGGGHSHSNSGADSVGYIKEEGGEDGSEVRWYLERRRRLSTGEVIIVGRELVEGGRI